ncbi:MAG: pyruvate oxidase [Hymenobacter sp.]|nr:MAG: pyruvate oxidase [Hymenobacter sp.]
MAKTGADLLVERLLDWGVDTIFSLPGDGINGIYESLRTHKEKINLVLVRQGSAAHDLSGTYWQQDVDLVKLYEDVAACNERVMGPDHVQTITDQAIRTALGQRTVAHISFPKDLQDWTTSDDKVSTQNVAGHTRPLVVSYEVAPAQAQLQKAADVLNAGKKVAILAGRGALDARAELVQVAELLGAPVAKALLGKGVLPDDSPYTTGGLGLLGTSASQDAMESCDTLLLIGTYFPYLEFYPKPGQARTVQIDLDATHIGLRTPVEVGLLGDCKTVLQGLLPLLKRQDDRSFLEEAQQHYKTWNELLTERGTQEAMPMKPQVIPHTLSPLLNADAIVTCDCGNNTTWAARHVQMQENTLFSTSGLLATMGAGLPYAIAAQVAYPGRQVVALVGDGGFTMLMGELATAVRYKLPIKVFIFNNQALGQIKWEQIVMEGNPEFGVDLEDIDFAKYAEACGAAGFTIRENKDAERVIREALAHDGPAVVNCYVDKNEPAMPGKVSTAQAIEFTKALARGERDTSEIIKNVLKDQFREAIATKGKSLLSVIPGL